MTTLKLEGGFDGVGDAVVAVGGGDAASCCARARVLRSSGALSISTARPAACEHGDVVPVVADGEDFCGVDPAGAGEREQGGALGAAGGEDVEDAEVARGILGAVEGECVAVRTYCFPPIAMKRRWMGHPSIRMGGRRRRRRGVPAGGPRRGPCAQGCRRAWPGWAGRRGRRGRVRSGLTWTR